MSEGEGSRMVDSSLMNRCSLAYMRLEVGIVPPAKLADARRYVETAGDSFDGRQLVDYCLEGRAGDGDAALEKAMRKLHASLAIESTGRRARKKSSLLVRLTATLIGRTIVFALTLIFIVLILVLVQSLVPALDIYSLRDTVLGEVKGLLGK